MRFRRATFSGHLDWPAAMARFRVAGEAQFWSTGVSVGAFRDTSRA